MEYYHVSSRFSQPPASHVPSADGYFHHDRAVFSPVVRVANGGNYGFLLPIPIAIDSIWVVPVITRGPFSSHIHGGHATVRQTLRGAPFQPSGSLRGGVHEDDTWILNVHDHHLRHSSPEASPQAPSSSNGLTEHSVTKFLETRTSETSGDDEGICVVCQDDLSSDRIATLDCRHRYHVHCIKTWLSLKNFCPICRAAALSTVWFWLNCSFCFVFLVSQNSLFTIVHAFFIFFHQLSFCNLVVFFLKY